jgi:polysaccharide biosynthesis/export protein
MKHLSPYLILILLFLSSCTSQKKLAYLRNLPEPNGQDSFRIEIPDYKLQQRDILYISVKAMTPEGVIKDYLSSTGSMMSISTQTDAGGSLYGYTVSSDGTVLVPALGEIKVAGLNLEGARNVIQKLADKAFPNSTVDCKLLSFKYTVIGEVKSPGTYTNYNTFLTVLEAIGRSGGIGDFGNRDRALVIRICDNVTKTYRVNLQDKSIITSPAYFLLPNDVIIIEPMKHKIFNLNLPTISFLITTVTSTITMTVLLLNYSK